MTLMKASLLAMSYAGALGVGVLMAPFVTGTHSIPSSPTVPAVGMKTAQARPAPATPPRQQDATVVRIAAVDATGPALQARMKHVLSPGTNLVIAASGFGSAEHFATVAYLAHNTGIPFVLLKHRVLNKGRTLTQAVQMSRPDANAALEVARARAEARSELWAIG